MNRRTTKTISKEDIESIRTTVIDKPKSKVSVSVKGNRPLTRKEKAFADKILDDPSKTIKQAYKEVYNVGEHTQDKTIRVEATRTLAKPQLKSYLAQYSNLVENTLLNTVVDWGREDNTRKREIANTTAMYIHDKIHGKATQTIQQRSEIVKIAINLSGDGEEPPKDLIDIT